MMRLRALVLVALLLPGANAAPPLPTPFVDPHPGEFSLYAEEFQGAIPLHERGWTTITAIGPRPSWRLDGANATTANEHGTYAARLDARLVSPVYDLRYVPVAPLPDLVAAPLPSSSLGQRLATLDARPAIDALDDALLWPPGGNATSDRFDLGASPLGNSSDLPSPRANVSAPKLPASAAGARLLVQHAWSFSSGDGATVEARWRDDGGSWSDWTPLAARHVTADAVELPGILPASGLAGYNGALSDGSGAFVGDSAGMRASEFDLGAFAGHEVQVAFRVRADSPLPPDTFGHRIGRAELRGHLAGLDVAVAGFGPLADGALVAQGTSFVPLVEVRNWGIHHAGNLTLRARLTIDGALAPGWPVVEPLDLAPGEHRLVALRSARSAQAANVTLSAEIVHPIVRVDARPGNDRADVSFRIADEPRLSLDLHAPPSSIVTGLREEKRIAVDVRNLGTAPALGPLVLHAGSATVATKDVSVPAAGSILGSALPEKDPIRVELTWAPAERGSHDVRAEMLGARSPATPVHVDRSPPPLLDDPFAAEAGAHAAFDPLDPDGLPNWSFESWSLDGANVTRDDPAAPSPRRMLVARASDDLAGAELAALHDLGAVAARETALTLALPTRANLSNDIWAPSKRLGVNLSYARLLFVAQEAGCPCDDARGQLPLLAPLLNATVHQENLTLAKDNTSVVANDTTLRLGDAQDASLLYVVVNATVQPGIALAYAPLVVTRSGGDTAHLLPASEPVLYDDGGQRCCIVGPYSSRDLLGAITTTPLPLRAPTTHVATQHTIARPLDDLLAGLPPSMQTAIVLEHRASFRWANGTGTRGVVELEPAGSPPPELRAPVEGARYLENATSGWEEIWIPLAATDLATPPRLRLTLETATSEDPIADCAYLDPRARCDVAPSWHVDSLRIVQRPSNTTPWAIARADDLEREHLQPRWSGATGAGIPSTEARGWTLHETTREPLHRFHMPAGLARDGEERPTRALGWGSARNDSLPIWSVARSPAVDLSALGAPTLTLETRFDFGADEQGSFPAGGAIAALVELPNGSLRRHLLVPSGPAGYGAHVSAPPFEPLAKALRLEVPRGATASAFVGRADHWTRVEVDLSPIRGAARAWIELHAVSARTGAATWEIDELRVGEPGPAHDLAIVGLPTLPSGADVGKGVPTPLAFEIADLGLFPPQDARLDVWITDPTGDVSYAANLTLGEIRDRAEVAMPTAWTPTTYGRHLVRARIAGAPADERPANDAALREVDVRDELGAALLDARTRPERPVPDAPVALEIRVHNNGTLPLEGRLTLQVYDGESALFADPVRVELAALAARPIRSGETIDLSLASAWTPTKSGVYRVSLAIEIESDVVSTLVRTVRVEETLGSFTLTSFSPEGAGWTNASASDSPAAWTFVADGPAEGNLTSPPVNLRAAASATLSLTHRHKLEEGFDGGLVEARLANGTWSPLAPLDEWMGTMLAPSRLVPPDALSADAFTGAASTRTTRFDLAAVPTLREPVVLVDTARGDLAAFVERSLGPQADAGSFAPSAPVPSGAPADAVAYERTDALRYAIEVPAGARGDLRVSLRDWRALGEHGTSDLDASRVLAYLELPGARYDAADDGPMPRSEWTTRELRFPNAPDLAGRSAFLVFEHVEVAARDGQTFASDLLAPHYGYALAQVTATVGTTTIEPRDAHARTSARWILADGDSVEAGSLGGFRPIEAAPPVWVQEEAGWRASVAGPVPDARLVLPLDLRLAVHRAAITLDHAATLSRSNVSVEVSADGGTAWRTAVANGSSFDLSPYVGSEILVALHARFSSDPAAREDEWLVRSVRIEADIFRGDIVEIRLRGASDADGARGTWEIADAALSVLRHGRGIGLRLLAPAAAPTAEGFRTIAIEAINRGPDTTPPAALSLLVTDPAERGGRGHGANRTIPPLGPGERAIVTIRGADVNWFLAANATPSRIEARAGPVHGESYTVDNRGDWLVGGENVRERSTLVPLRVDVSPQALVLGPNASPRVSFAARIVNDGESAATLAPSILRLWKDGINVRNLTNAVPSGGRVGPGESREILWTWRPDPTLERGSYHVEAEIATSTPRGSSLRSATATLLVGDAYFGEHARLERFGGGLDAWTCVSQAPCAKEETTLFRSSPASLSVGLPATTPTATGGRAVIASPELPLNATLGGVLRLYARHALAPVESARILVANVSVDGSVGGFREVGRATGRSAGYDELRFVELSYPIPPNATLRGVLVRFDAPVPSNASAPSFLVDDVSLAPLAPAWEPAPRVHLADGVAKTFRLSLTNAGALTDTYAIALRDADGRPAVLPAGWSLEVRDASTGRPLASATSGATGDLSVPANGTRALDVRVASAPTGPGAPLRGPVPIAITANSTTLPDLSRTLKLDLRARGAARSDVGILAVEVRGANEPPGRSRTIEAALVNRGLAPASAELRVIAHPPDGVEEAPETLADLQGKTAPSATLAPGARRTVTLLWTPRHAGEHRLVASLDPTNALREADRGDHTLERTIRVAALPFPDLRVRLALATDEAYLGRPTEVTLNVTNRGPAAARDVGVALRAGVVGLLPEGSPTTLGDLAPGQTRLLRAAWTPEIPGNVTLLATAFARSGLSEPVETLDDNARTLAILVREPSAQLSPLPGPGEFLLTNGGNADETYLLRASVPADWSYSIRIGEETATRVDLAANATASIRLDAIPPVDVLAGSYGLVLEAVSSRTGELRRAPTTHVVPAKPGLRAVMLPVALDPREPAIEVLLENSGNARENVTFKPIELPPGWRLDGARATVGPREQTKVRILLDLGAHDAPATHPVILRWDGGQQTGWLAGDARVEAAHDLDITVRAEAVAGRDANLTLTLRNLGNVLEQGILRVGVPDGFATDLTERGVRLAPGETIELAGSLAAPTDGTGRALIEARFEGDTTVVARERVDVVSADLRLEWAPASPSAVGGPTRESVRLANVGRAAARDTVVALYVDGAPVATRALGELPAGAEADATLAWTPPPGTHTVAIVVKALDGSADATPADNARAFTYTAAEALGPVAAAAARADVPPGPIALLLLAAALLALGRRR